MFVCVFVALASRDARAGPSFSRYVQPTIALLDAHVLAYTVTNSYAVPAAGGGVGGQPDETYGACVQAARHVRLWSRHVRGHPPFHRATPFVCSFV
jgi:hypothetical protein